jgi:hypothetical protein
LLDVEQVAYEQFMLIAAKTLADHTTKGRPIQTDELALDRLEPTTGCTSKLHRGTLDPH